jgi:hypothetical protein
VASQACIKALAEAGCLHGRRLLFPRDVDIHPFVRVGGDAQVVRMVPHALVGAGLVVQGRDLSCEAETCRVRDGGGFL